ncbi:hypothetical protein BpHYR1_039146 [Brachionus plicatilis]|uniref:Uncharacterized protein n=1 Tax=Brachionus plicatilis TaxID=10195 RepID=A0A3M7RJU1_BRAPC|nr:hypothetical protein BpHYR1_039146 [Brachionus plicatilis]
MFDSNPFISLKNLVLSSEFWRLIIFSSCDIIIKIFIFFKNTSLLIIKPLELMYKGIFKINKNANRQINDRRI